MKEYILRLDDACEKRDIVKWDRMEALLEKYNIKPLVGVIPHCEDPMMDSYEEDQNFWNRVFIWQQKGWTVAIHGYDHVYSTGSGGINPVNKRSEFAGEPLEKQKEKIRNGVAVMRQHSLEPRVFFAPSHTFDENTLTALKNESHIRIISDTMAWDCYEEGGFTFVPQQSGQVRSLPFRVVTFCYHPNTMNEASFERLKKFLADHAKQFICFPVSETKRKRSVLDKALKSLYFHLRKA
jgi:predicted deacetylase